MSRHNGRHCTRPWATQSMRPRGASLQNKKCFVTNVQWKMHIKFKYCIIHLVGSDFLVAQCFITDVLWSLMTDGIKDLRKRSFLHSGCNNLLLKELFCAATVSWRGWEELDLMDSNLSNLLLSPSTSTGSSVQPRKEPALPTSFLRPRPHEAETGETVPVSIYPVSEYLRKDGVKRNR